MNCEEDNMRIKVIFSLRASFTTAFLIISAAFLLNNCGNGGSGGGQQPLTGSMLNDITVPIEDYNTALTADEPSVTSNHLQLPQGFQVDLLDGFSINSKATLKNITITRTDNSAIQDPTVDFKLSVAAGDAPGACASGTGTEAFQAKITGNEDFSSTDVSADKITMSQDALDIISSRDFTLCTNATSTVDVDLTISGINMSFSVEQDCDAQQDLAGTWTGTFYCEDVCDGISSTTPVSDIELTITQSNGAAIYIDDGGAFYYGDVCASSFQHSGFGSSYYEWGTVTQTGPDTAKKVSTWVDFDNPSCGGTCYDTLTRSAP